MFEVNPVTDLFGQFVPQVFVFQYFPPAGFVIFLDGNLFPDVFLGYAESRFNADRSGISRVAEHIRLKSSPVTRILSLTHRLIHPNRQPPKMTFRFKRRLLLFTIAFVSNFATA